MQGLSLDLELTEATGVTGQQVPQDPPGAGVMTVTLGPDFFFLWYRESKCFP